MKEKISFYQKFGASAEDVSLSIMLEAIRIGAYKDLIEKLRSVKNDEAKYGELKKLLPHFTPTGTFKVSRSANNLSVYNSVIVLDIDKVGDDAMFIRDNSARIESTLAAFISPGGDGVKILVKTSTDESTHATAYNQIAEFYEKELAAKVDRSGKDISRACFVSYDPDLYSNEEAKPFQVKSVTESPTFMEISTTSNNMAFENVVTFTEKSKQYFTGNRNNFVCLLANNLNRIGISSWEAESSIIARYSDLKDAEIKATVKSAYSNTDDHGIWSLNYVSSVSSASAAKKDLGDKTPFIPKDVYEDLPELLEKIVEAFELRREKDVIFTSGITILSGLFNTVVGIYDKREYHPNLNCFIIAPPGGGKGVVNGAKDLGKKVHDTNIFSYEAEIALGGEGKGLPRTHYIPADSSAAAVQRILMLNNGIGTICETEADTLSATLQQDWGGYSDMIRKAFHHEPITFSRIDKNDGVKHGEIKRPKLSICLTGTPSQVPSLLKSTQDGLFSRILFYTYRHTDKPKFKNVFSSDGVSNVTDYFEKLSNKVYSYSELAKKNPRILFSLQKNQQLLFVQKFDVLIKKVIEISDEDAISIVYRLGLITFRIAMIFTILREIEKGKIGTNIICSDEDFGTCLILAEVYFEHSLVVYQSLSGNAARNSNYMSLFEFLPNEFTHKEAIKIGTVVAGFSTRTVENYLNKLKDSGLLKQKKRYGSYFK